jgi:uncharacterized membrane protein
MVMMGFGNGLGYGFGGVLWVLGCVLVVVGLVALVAWALSRATAHDHEPKPAGRSEALDILGARFARGEMTEAEYKLAANVLRTDR